MRCVAPAASSQGVVLSHLALPQELQQVKLELRAAVLQQKLKPFGRDDVKVVLAAVLGRLCGTRAAWERANATNRVDS